ncbi:energy transducer TonB [Niabella sp. W65]|nr:energy transducer TonB [Niabella sp. W65]MCH7366823.1 energy transducer TonB [Niabella sp. W65]ULT42524.1 energy transducer TonB [Niabella sp. I65]
MRDARKAQAEAASANEVIYPEEGWSHFYEELGTSLGVDKAKKTKTLQIKFTVDDNGDPVDFEVVESPDAILAKKAIEFIKKAKWKNFKLDKNALVKIEVN